MRKCNICGSNRPEVWYKTKNKKTCRSCERGWKGFYYRYLVQQRQLTLFQRTISIRICRSFYWPTHFRTTFIYLGFLCVLIQVFSRKQWNLVILQLNGLITWTIHFINQLN